MRIFWKNKWFEVFKHLIWHNVLKFCMWTLDSYRLISFVSFNSLTIYVALFYLAFVIKIHLTWLTFYLISFTVLMLNFSTKGWDGVNSSTCNELLSNESNIIFCQYYLCILKDKKWNNFHNIETIFMVVNIIPNYPKLWVGKSFTLLCHSWL